MYYFYFGKLLLPVAPEKMKLTINNSNETYTLINEGEINVLKKAGLTDIEFELLIPAVKYSFANYSGGFHGVKYYLDAFEKLKTSKKPFQFIVSRTFPNGKVLYNTNMKVSLEEYTIEESKDEGFDARVSITLKQYRDFGTKTCTIKFQNSKPVAKVSNKRSSDNAPSNGLPTQYTVTEKGDCMWNICRKYYGGVTWAIVNKLEEANQNVTKGRPKYEIWVGDKLTVPKI